MEHTNNAINTVDIIDDTIVILYDNDATEVLPISLETYANMRKEWLIDQPPFISDRYKSVMNNIILATIQKKASSINELAAFFTQENKDTVKLFLIYMRTRDLTAEKLKWTKIKELNEPAAEPVSEPV
jgi:hypothetical protein